MVESGNTSDWHASSFTIAGELTECTDRCTRLRAASSQISLCLGLTQFWGLLRSRIAGGMECTLNRGCSVLIDDGALLSQRGDTRNLSTTWCAESKSQPSQVGVSQ